MTMKAIKNIAVFNLRKHLPFLFAWGVNAGVTLYTQ